MAQRQDSQNDDIVNGAVLTFFSTASSVGKTLISCNMASELARQGRRVCLVDLDLQFGDICNYLNLKAENTIADAQRSLQLMGDSCQIAEYCTPYEMPVCASMSWPARQNSPRPTTCSRTSS